MQIAKFWRYLKKVENYPTMCLTVTANIKEGVSFFDDENLSRHNMAIKSTHPAILQRFILEEENKEKVCVCVCVRVWPRVARSIWHCAECAACLMKSSTNKHSAHSVYSLYTDTYREDGAMSHSSRADNMIDYMCGQSLFHQR